MVDPHLALGRFFDGELSATEVDAFREHLTTCDRCQDELEELLQLDALGTRYLQLKAANVPRVVRLKPAPRPAWFRWVGSGGALAAAAALALIVIAPWKPSVPDTVWQPGGDGRLVMARSSYSRASQYRKLERPLGFSKPSLPLREMAKLGEDHLAVASAYLVRGDPGLMENALQGLDAVSQPSPDIDSERAMAHLIRGDADRLDYEEALRATEKALQVNPKHGPALWNKALALQGLGLKMRAAETFDQVVQLDEPGWSSEARSRAAELRSEAAHMRDTWRQAREAALGLVKSGSTLPPDALSAPISRMFLYHAVQARGTAEEVWALLSLADQLDEKSGGTHLHDYVRWAAGRDFKLRGPVAEKWRRFYLGGEVALVPELWSSGEDDIAMGAKSRASAAPSESDVKEFERRAKVLKDPWFDVLALKERGKLLGSSDLRAAQKTLENAIQVADASRIQYLSLLARIDLITFLLRGSELDVARTEAAKAWELAAQTGDWGMQRQILELLAQLARVRVDYPVSKAYLEEAVERTREDHQKEHELFVREGLALLEVENLHFEEAREQLDAAIATGLPLSTIGAGVLADVARQRPAPMDRQAIDAHRTRLAGMSRSERALATESIGRWSLEVNPEEGRKLLRDAIVQVGTVVDPDGDASRARSFAYSALIMDAAKRRDYGGALALFGEEAGAPFPATCALALNVDMERSAAVVRGPAGELEGEYDGARTVLAPEKLDGLVSPRLVAALNGCREVKVVARPPLFGRLGALPNMVPWSYVLLGRSATPPRAAPSQGTHLVVQSVVPSARFTRWGLKVPQALVPSHPPPNGFTVVEGAEATPNRILDELKTAADVDLVTHSLINPNSGEAFLMASEGPEGDMLTATRIRDASLQNQPIVMLSACYAAHTSPVLYEARSLPAAFLIAGAKAVFAAHEEVPEKEGPAFFDAVRARIRSGISPALALHDVRQALVSEGKVRIWVQSVLVFE